MSMKSFSLATLSLSVLGLCAGCPSTGSDDLSASEVAVSAVSGALNNTEGSTALGLGALPREKRGMAARVWDQLNPIGTAFAATWTCTGATLAPAWSGPAGDPYAYTPVSCSVSFRDGKSASVVWSSTFALSWGSACDAKSPFMDDQAAGCTLTRTTSPDGNTRTLTGPHENTVAVTHNTFGAGTGWDDSVAPAPGNDGVILACGPSGCAASRTLVISGSHLTGQVNAFKVWDHTVSTGAGGLAVTGRGAARVVTGTVYVQHNLAHVTSATTFNDVGYGDTACCYPTRGSVTTTFSKGPDLNRTETLAFTAACGEASLTRADGTTVALTLEECL